MAPASGSGKLKELTNKASLAIQRKHVDGFEHFAQELKEMVKDDERRHEELYYKNPATSLKVADHIGQFMGFLNLVYPENEIDNIWTTEYINEEHLKLFIRFKAMTGKGVVNRGQMQKSTVVAHVFSIINMVAISLSEKV
ncbi:hypothetical protein DFQ28_000943 [Apophysomyces sp. BC1034]|nr:hypothetical protein DFQ30_008773 [Apophysomyces sp. BC1015]KAG0183333.1 hypothetical protein DFQ29_006902 [Apophysomyces sp. BC1021]KAG0194224.1 hypothetical protein DFQ28_000943 [Apophysomyces sp. BC1034]